MLREDQFCREVRTQHAAAFRLHAEGAEKLEALVKSKRAHSSAVAIALDMLMVQAYKAHHSVRVLAERAHTEDAATIARRLLELAVQAIYIGGDSEKKVRDERASRYIADLWDKLSDVSRSRMPANVRSQWEAIAQAAGILPSKRPRWGPDFRQMFEYADLAATYEQDYRYLSSLAHGSSEEQVLQFSLPQIPMRPTHHSGMLVVFATRYYLAVVEMWNRAYNLLPIEWFNDFSRRIGAWR